MHCEIWSEREREREMQRQQPIHLKQQQQLQRIRNLGNHDLNGERRLFICPKNSNGVLSINGGNIAKVEKSLGYFHLKRSRYIYTLTYIRRCLKINTGSSSNTLAHSLIHSLTQSPISLSLALPLYSSISVCRLLWKHAVK